MKRDLKYYRALPYARAVERLDEEGQRYFVARIPDLPGCLATGKSSVEALAYLKEAFDEYISAKLEWGTPIPEPSRLPGPKVQTPRGGWKTDETQPAEGPSTDVISDLHAGTHG